MTHKLCSLKQSILKTSIKIKKIYPLNGSKRVKNIESLKTVGFYMTPKQAEEMATAALVIAQQEDCEAVRFTGFREELPDGGYRVTVTGIRDVKD